MDLSVINFCNGQDTKTKTYISPKDTSTYIPLKMQIGKRLARGNTDVTVPIELLDDFSGELFHGATFSIQFDPACIAFHDSVRSCLKVWVPAAENTVGVGTPPSEHPSMPMLELYPHPFGRTLFVRAVALRHARHRLTVTDIVGREVHARDYPCQSAIFESLDMTGIPPGMYIVRLSGENALLSRIVRKQ